MPEFYSKIPALMKTLNDEQKEQCFKFAQEQLGPYIYGAPFANRAYFKPRGYAGDYEMMNQLYRNDIAGASLFDQTMHRYLIDEPAAEAVKNRSRYLLKQIQKSVEEEIKRNPNSTEPIRILSIASGPALEVQLFLSQSEGKYSRKIEFHFIDQDEEALKHAQREMMSIERFVKSGNSFNFHNLAIKNILTHGVPVQDCDLIYSAGLFDYFTDPVATAAAQRMHAAIKDNGTVIIGNFSKENPTAPLMELFLEWHLIYRSVEDLERIFKPASKKIEVEWEPLKINLFAVLRK